MPTDFFHTCREINQLLGAVAFLWLVYRSVRAWPADWAKPDHQWHYRGLLVISSSFTLAVSLSGFQYEWSDAPAGPVSALYSVLCLVVLGACWYWPQPKSWRDPRADTESSS